jgi:glutathione synthase/RimK-type ligase-like ATP-grasp enzyme
MVLANKERVLVSVVKEIAAEQGLTLTSFSQDWLMRLEHGNKAAHILGYNFELNSATAQMIAGDKSAISDMMAHIGLPRVEHKLFLHPRLAGYVSPGGNWQAMLAYAEQTGFPLVVKPNIGTGGEGVSRVESAAELERATMTIFQSNRGLCLSPFLEIEQEYRAVMLDGECELLYAKRRPHVIGDGQSSVLELIEMLHLKGELSQAMAGQAVEQHRGDLKQVPPAGQEVLIGWKHNLGEGSAPTLVEAGPLQQELVAMARKAAAAINIRFASVDIVESGGELLLLEINSGVMMEYFARQIPDGRERAKAIYAKAIAKMLPSG